MNGLNWIKDGDVAYESTMVRLENGKYLYECDRGTVTIKRFGDPWRTEPAGDKALISLIHECADAKQRVADIMSELQFLYDTGDEEIDRFDILRILEENG